MQITTQDGVTITLTQAQIDEIKAQTEKPEFEYPLVMKSKSTGIIVQFTSLTSGTCIFTIRQGNSMLGSDSEAWIAHTDTDNWEPVPYDKERDLWHGQPVYCWDDDETHSKTVRFYNAPQKSVFSYDGDNVGITLDNYEAVPIKHYEPWIFNAYQTLRGIN